MRGLTKISPLFLALSLQLAACGGGDESPSPVVPTPPAPSMSSVVPFKLLALGLPLTAYVMVSTNPGVQVPLTLDPATNSFKGTVTVPSGVSVDLTVVYAATDPASGQTVQLAH